MYRQTKPAVDYLARYIHLIARSNRQLLFMGGDGIAFRYKNYRDHAPGRFARQRPASLLADADTGYASQLPQTGSQQLDFASF